MDLFSQKISQPENLLPKEGVVKYYGLLLPYNDAQYFFERLMTEIEWKNDRAVIYGKLIVTKRKVAWYGERPFQYTYSNTTKQALPWTNELLQLKALVENETGEHFNSCLLNLYHDGSEGMAWHSDGEKDLKKNGAIASISLGAQRKFAFKHKESQEKVELILEHGSLLVMSGATQTYWQHRLPPMKRIDEPRINLTFRSINQTPKL
jgi:alkylated DNA repair dioxygenase AlkB